MRGKEAWIMEETRREYEGAGEGRRKRKGKQLGHKSMSLRADSIHLDAYDLEVILPSVQCIDSNQMSGT